MKPVPDIDSWQPRKDSSNTLKDIFYKRCQHVELLILEKVRQEKQFNLDNFDSGLGVEDIIREEFEKLLPERYFVTKGMINDRNGFTSGDSDLIIFNKFWFPFLKSGATLQSRKFYFPIEGVYGVGEIKQTLTIDSLDEAIQKLVITKRLHRPKTGRNRIVENRELEGCEHGNTNPLYSFILATNLEDGLSKDDIFMRFFEINKKLKRSELVNGLCILQNSTILWAYFDGSNKELKPAMFHDPDDDLSKPLLPILIEADAVRKNSLYDLIMNITTHIYHTVLGAEDLVAAYGNNYNNIKTPPPDKFLINPR